MPATESYTDVLSNVLNLIAPSPTADLECRAVGAFGAKSSITVRAPQPGILEPRMIRHLEQQDELQVRPVEILGKAMQMRYVFAIWEWPHDPVAADHSEIRRTLAAQVSAALARFAPEPEFLIDGQLSVAVFWRLDAPVSVTQGTDLLRCLAAILSSTPCDSQTWIPVAGCCREALVPKRKHATITITHNPDAPAYPVASLAEGIVK